MRGNRNLIQVLVTLSVITSCLCFLACSSRKPFDSEGWKKGDIVARGQMARNLSNGELLNRKSKAEVLELLGKPDYESGDSWVYRVDVGEKFGDAPWLYNLFVVFGSNGRVERIALDD